MTKTQKVVDLLTDKWVLTHADIKEHKLGRVSSIICRLRKRGYIIDTVYIGKEQCYVLRNRRGLFYKLLKWVAKKCAKYKY